MGRNFRKLDIPVSNKIINEIVSNNGNNISQISYDDEYHIKLSNYNGLNYYVDFSPILYMKKNGLPVEEFMVFYIEVSNDPYDYDNYETHVYVIIPTREIVFMILEHVILRNNNLGGSYVFDTTLSNDELLEHLSKCVRIFLRESLGSDPSNELVLNVTRTIIP